MRTKGKWQRLHCGGPSSTSRCFRKDDSTDFFRERPVYEDCNEARNQNRTGPFHARLASGVWRFCDDPTLPLLTAVKGSPGCDGLEGGAGSSSAPLPEHIYSDVRSGRIANSAAVFLDRSKDTETPIQTNTRNTPAMAPATITVVYPQGGKFDMDYYKSTHMPLVQKKWSSHGLTSWKVVKLSDDAPYAVLATLEFKDTASWQAAATSPEAKEVLGDVPNFSDKEPVIMSGEEQFTS
ncbi:unnamed protein product [Zymoseptoria tritici ST99CH_1A5]|uniref:EthD domain-containing protein n=2 Tax=Zymoseptoria tritici TaxID=1047171 RepID=A0A2H1FMD3_ZYMTR|nr:unnamed protein product [Zymoseptoria tritici ST99CH_1E4]SMY19723.1 unnamed protein product [Zymoseptoria tritici ST99CH_1A5]